MSNICMDTVVFYAKSQKEKVDLATLKLAFEKAYPSESAVDNKFSRFFVENNLPTQGLHLKGEVVELSLDGDVISLSCDVAWKPMYDAYACIADAFDVRFVMEAEEPGFEIYINTDCDSEYLTNRYKVYLSERPEDGSLDKIFDYADDETDFYFSSKDELLRWFSEHGEIEINTVHALQEQLGLFIMVYEYSDYQ